jgi:hypothetical protein
MNLFENNNFSENINDNINLNININEIDENRLSRNSSNSISTSTISSVSTKTKSKNLILTPPTSFSLIEVSISRCFSPILRNHFSFIKSTSIKTIINLSGKLSSEFESFCDESDISVVSFFLYILFNYNIFLYIYYNFCYFYN